MPTLSLCVIARDEEMNLPLCLNSVARVVDEMVVVDTGSVDRTVEVARQLGARVVPFEWCDDFAAAKNFAIDQAAGEWILFLDADEMVVPETVGSIRPLIDLAQDRPRCYRLIRRDLVDQAGRRVVCNVPVDRLFAHHPGLRFVRPIHEQLVYLGGPGELELVQTERVRINHFGYTSQGQRSPAKRHRRDIAILERLIAARPDEGINYYYLGRELLDHGEIAPAIEQLRESFRRARPIGEEQWLSDAFSRCVAAHYLAGELDAALAVGEEAVARFDEGPLWCNLGVAHAARGDDARAIACFERARQHEGRPAMVPTDVAATTWRPLTNLATIFERQGDPARAYDLLVQAARYLPEDRELAERTERMLRAATYQPVARLAAGPPARGRIVFFVGPSLEPWNPTNLGRGGIGGSETAVIHVARELRALGYEVVVYGDPGESASFDGVPYLDWRTFDPGRHCDLFVAVRLAAVFDMPLNTGMSWLWMHDTSIGPTLTPKRLDRVDYVLALTQWHRAFLQALYRIPPGKLLVTRNGIDLTRFPGNLPRRPHRLVYSSAPNRGLDRILALWPRIRGFWPDAELHVFYGWKTYDATIKFQPDQAVELTALKQKILSLIDQPGVFFHDRVDQQRLAGEYLRSEVWFYPTDWTETFCITALEAQAAGCIPVTNNLAALAEVVRGGIVLPHDASDDAYLDALQRLDDPALRADLRRQGREWVAGFTWTAVAREWHLRFHALRQTIGR